MVKQLSLALFASGARCNLDCGLVKERTYTCIYLLRGEIELVCGGGRQGGRRRRGRVRAHPSAPSFDGRGPSLSVDLQQTTTAGALYQRFTLFGIFSLLARFLLSVDQSFQAVTFTPSFFLPSFQSLH